MGKRQTEEDYICSQCGFIGRATRRMRGSAGMERLMWYVLMIPGPFYSYWRRSGDQYECSACESDFIVDVDSKLGKIMLENKLKGKTDKPKT